MSDKQNRKPLKSKASNAAKATHEVKNTLLDNEIKAAAGKVQKELAPIRASANNAHKH